MLAVIGTFSACRPVGLGEPAAKTNKFRKEIAIGRLAMMAIISMNSRLAMMAISACSRRAGDREPPPGHDG
eukprot:7828169-Heterocapsa_arctica.AAC.1